jgi:hypothetical protein
VNLNDLKRLHAAVESLLQQESFSRAVESLRLELTESPEPFVWSPIDLNTLGIALPAPIKSGWIFLLKSGVPSGCHYHPNSVQHMVALNGQGRSKVGGLERAMIPFESDRHSIEEKWCVISEGVPHEFFPEGEEMTIVSFHTCTASELEEIACANGTSRRYDPTEIRAPQLEH